MSGVRLELSGGSHVERITGLPNVEVVTGAQLSGLDGRDGVLETVRWRRRGSDEETTRPVRHLFLFIGADLTGSSLAGGCSREFSGCRPSRRTS